jgi:general secretion pathway protein G
MLIVIAIIAILASVALVSVRGVRSSANDTKRISDLNKVQQQLEVYYTKNGAYPATPVSWAALSGALGSGATLPDDSAATAGTHYEYAADAGGQHYTLKAQLENKNKVLDDPNELDGTSNTIACDDVIDASHWGYCIGN